MQFDIFHSISRTDTIKPRLSDLEVFKGFFAQAVAAEALGFNTLWVAESHFSSEVQKQHRQPVIPNYQGEVGLNCDSMQLFTTLMAKTTRLNLGTAIFNIVGGNGGPLAAADRIRTLAFLNGLAAKQRELYIGVAAGRFPYINTPFGITPRDEEEQQHWDVYKRYIFLEALEIFLRLSLGETLSSEQIRTPKLAETGRTYRRRWEFETLKLVPELSAPAREHLHFVLGSHDPLARDLGLTFCDLDVFNLSFTPPEQLNRMHDELTKRCDQLGRKPWQRSRLPRTVLVFIDESEQVAARRASQCFNTYIEAMQGTAQVPDKNILLERALIGTPEQICEQLSSTNPRGFRSDDRLMLWFEFNQSVSEEVITQMALFAEKVAPNFR